MSARTAKYGLSVIGRLKARLTQTPDREVAEVSKQGIIDRLVPEPSRSTRADTPGSPSPAYSPRRGFRSAAPRSEPTSDEPACDGGLEEGPIETQTTSRSDRGDGRGYAVPIGHSTPHIPPAACRK